MIRKSPWTWTLVAFLVQTVALVFLPGYVAKAVATIVLMAIAGPYIWTREKYRPEMSSNRWSPLVAMFALGMMFAAILAYSNLCKWFPSVFN